MNYECRTIDPMEDSRKTSKVNHKNTTTLDTDYADQTLGDARNCEPEPVFYVGTLYH